MCHGEEMLTSRRWHVDIHSEFSEFSEFSKLHEQKTEMCPLHPECVRTTCLHLHWKQIPNFPISISYTSLWQDMVNSLNRTWQFSQKVQSQNSTTTTTTTLSKDISNNCWSKPSILDNVVGRCPFEWFKKVHWQRHWNLRDNKKKKWIIIVLLEIHTKHIQNRTLDNILCKKQ